MDDAEVRRASTPELEARLRDAALPADVRNAISEELTRRYTENLLGGDAPSGSGRQSAAPPDPPRVPPPAASRPPTTGGSGVPAKRSGAAGRILAVALLVIGGIAVFQWLAGSLSSGGSGGSGPTSRTTLGYTCLTPFGRCPLASGLPIDSPCQCFRFDGTADSGTVQ